MTLFVNLAQAAALLNTDEDGVRAYIEAGDLTLGPYGIPTDAIALLLLDLEREAAG